MTLKIIINDKSVNLNKTYKIVDTSLIKWLNYIDEFVSTTNNKILDSMRILSE